MLHRSLLTIFLGLAPALLFAGDWVDEAEKEDGVAEKVRDATLDYAKSGYQHSRVIDEGTLERFPFGHREPTLICAPLRICAIVLEAGETVIDVVTGDTQHWQTFDLSTGPAGAATPVVGVRPMVDFEFADTCDKTTNLVITTDRRIYSVLLELPPCSEAEARDPNPHRAYHRQLGFYYPDELISRWHTRAQLRKIQEAAMEAAEDPRPPPTLAASGVEGLNWAYRVRKERNPFKRKRSARFPWRPQAVFDDGVRTYIRLPPEAREVPAVFEVSGSEDVVVNFAPAADDASLLILPRVAEHLVLVLPRGKRHARLHLINEASP